MKKKTVYLGLLFSMSAFFSVSNDTYAEEGSMPANAAFKEGEFKVEIKTGGIEFPEITPVKAGRRLYNPTIHKNDFIDYLDPDLYSSWFGGNPLSEDYTEPSFMPPAPGWGAILPAVSVSNYANIDEWRVKLSRTPMKNEKNEVIENDYLFIGNINDYTNDKNFLTTVSKDTIVTESKKIVAEFSGENAKKIHHIAPFGDVKFDGASQNDELLSIKNIAYGVTSDTKIPRSGNYSSSLVWTIEKGPESEAVE